MSNPLTIDQIEHAINNREEMLEALDAADAQERLIDFMKFLWPVLEPGRPLIVGWALEAIAEHLEAVSHGHIKKLLINVPPGLGKPLCVDTPVLTTWGWKRHADLEVDDFVYGIDGKPKRVLGVQSPVKEQSYQVIFDDNTSLISGKDHLWSVERDYPYGGINHTRARKTEIVTTANLRDRSRCNGPERADRIEVTNPIVIKPNNLLIDPYILGCWLGDGASKGGQLYVAETDKDHFLNYGSIGTTFPPDGKRKQYYYRFNIEGLSTKLRLLNLIDNKHIPEDFLLSSKEQRLALIQGFMDTDGTVRQDGHCSFSNNNKILIDGIVFLLNSFGVKVGVRSKYSYVNGVKYGPHYLVSFSCPEGLDVFRLRRKSERIKHASNIRTKRRYIVEVKPIGERVVNCISVEGEMYLAGKSLIATHNSIFSNVYWPAWEWGALDKGWYRYVAVSYSQALTIRDNRRMRQLIVSDRYQKFWGDKFTLSEDEASRIKFSNDKQGFKLASSIGGAVMGERGDRVILDDPNETRQIEDSKKIENALQFFTEVLPTRINDPKTSATVVIQQRTHERDISGHILSHDLGYEHLMLPMEFDPERKCHTSIGFVDPRKNDGDLLFPERFDVDYLEKDLKPMLRSWGGTYAESGQLQQLPSPREGGMFKKHDFQVVDSIPTTIISMVRGWDLAASDTTRSPYTTGVKIGRGANKAYYIMDVKRERATPHNVELLLKSTSEQDGPQCLHALPQDPGQAGKSQKVTLTALLTGHNVRFSPETGSKIVRAVPLSAQCEGGNVYVVRGAWNDAYINEMASFPAGKYSDQVDASSRAFSYVQSKAPYMVPGTGPGSASQKVIT